MLLPCERRVGLTPRASFVPLYPPELDEVAPLDGQVQLGHVGEREVDEALQLLLAHVLLYGLTGQGKQLVMCATLYLNKH